MPNNPTLDEQRRAGLLTNFSAAILDCLAEPPRPAKRAHRAVEVPPPPKETQPRTLPPGVYLELSGRLVAKFVRHEGGRKVCVIVARGEYFDDAPATVARLAEQCKAAAQAWDARRHDDPER